jgi:outer membrane protein TolC
MKPSGLPLAAIALLAPLMAQQTGVPLSLEDCIRLAQSVQSAASVARQETEIAALGVRQARAAFLPQVRVQSGYTYNSPVNGGDTQRYIALNGIHEYVGLAAAGFELDTSGRLRASVARARAEQDIASAGFSLTQRDLRRLVTTAYLRLLLTRRLAIVAGETLAEAHSFEKRVSLLAEGGEAARADVVRASAEAAFFEQSRRAAELEAEVANYELASFWTVNVADRLSIVEVLDQLPPGPDPDNPGTPYLRRFEFSLLDAEKRGFQADFRRVRAELYPQLNLVYQYGLDASQVKAGNLGSAAFVNLNIPVFDWFKTRSAARQFQLRSLQTDARHQIAERTFSREYQTALARVKSLHAQIAVTDSQVKLSEQNLKLSRIRYEGGEGLALEVVTAQSQLGQARGNYYTTIANYLIARTDLEVAAGR